MALEVASVRRRAARAGRLDELRTGQALTDLASLPIPHGPLMGRIWDLRDNLTPYDAAYVALAEAVDAVLVTAGGQLAHAPRIECEIDLLP